MPRKSSPGIPIARAQAPEFRRRLLRWFRRHGRDLPWRRTRDPYRVLVSEFMLQQTQVSRVEAYYHRFLDRYPSVETLAAAAPAAVREAGTDWVTTGGRQTSTVGPAGGRRARRRHSGRPRRAARPARRRTIHRRAPWRASPTSARRRRSTRTSRGCSGGPSIRGCGGVGPQEALGHRRGAGAASGKAGVGVQPGDHGARRADLHGARSEVRRVPGERELQDGAGKRGTGNGERGTGQENGERGNGNGEQGTGRGNRVIH